MNMLSTLRLMEITADYCESDTKDILHLLRILTQICSMFFYLYELYSDEEALLKAIYLAAFLTANYCGATLGNPIGAALGTTTNYIIQNVSSLLAGGTNWTLSKLSSLGFLGGWLFKTSEDEYDSPAPDTILNFH